MTRQRTVEWQVCGVCNYDCSYCIQSRKYRTGQPSDEELEIATSVLERICLNLAKQQD